MFSVTVRFGNVFYLLLYSRLEKCTCYNIIFRAKELMTRRTALVVVLTLAVLLFLVNIHVFITYQLDIIKDTHQVLCRVSSAKFQYFALNIFPWIDLTLYGLLPSAIIVICNVLIVYNLSKSKKESIGKLAGKTVLQKSYNKIVPMLLLVSTVFVISTLPISVYLLRKLKVIFNDTKYS